VKTIVIGIIPQDKICGHLLAIARGEFKPKAGRPKNLVHLHEVACRGTERRKPGAAQGDPGNQARIDHVACGKDRQEARQPVPHAEDDVPLRPCRNEAREEPCPPRRQRDSVQDRRRRLTFVVVLWMARNTYGCAHPPSQGSIGHRGQMITITH